MPYSLTVYPAVESFEPEIIPSIACEQAFYISAGVIGLLFAASVFAYLIHLSCLLEK